MGFQADEVLCCTTSKAEKCITEELIEYIRAVIVASNADFHCILIVLRAETIGNPPNKANISAKGKLQYDTTSISQCILVSL